ncbi:MAG: saccharopine dehydrogenase [Bacteroidetes bacterium GWF2_49_14]|nr:MAG: saccharopine dehydrogenase [Bacteroidetes bacterium GWF2_49_14]HBB91216.1 saccharopine dehydrogenase [Bacteroidales bacterium]
MKKILVLGAGLSTSSLIGYLLRHAEKEDWQVTVGDVNLENARQKTGANPRGTAIPFDIFNEQQKNQSVRDADLVISMLPARFHPMVAEACLEFGRSMLTASYVSPEIRRLDYLARQKGILFFNELGVDPGIDHMSAMRVIDAIRQRGGKLTGFRSYTGGLIAPESDNNPWNYKFTWNPRNVVLAGQGTSMYIRNGQVKYIPYHQLFRQTEKASVLHLGEFEVYANRDSLQYREVYKLPEIKTLMRGTMRRPGYCAAWDVFVQLGMTDDSYTIDDSESMSWLEFTDAFVPGTNGRSVQERLATYLGIPADGEIMTKLSWLGLFEKSGIGLKQATPAQILQRKLEEKWKLEPSDKDMIVMQHVFDYEYKDKTYRHKSSLIVIGRDQRETAMSITVGTPLAIAARLVLNGTIRATGVQVPTHAEFYVPILQELKEYGVEFIEEEE